MGALQSFWVAAMKYIVAWSRHVFLFLDVVEESIRSHPGHFELFHVGAGDKGLEVGYFSC